jgi:hypothetical protein
MTKEDGFLYDAIFCYFWFFFVIILIITSVFFIIIIYFASVYPQEQKMKEFTPTNCTVLNNTCVFNNTIVNTTECFSFLKYGNKQQNFFPIYVELILPSRLPGEIFDCWFKIQFNETILLQETLIDWDLFNLITFSLFTGGLLLDCIISLIFVSVIYSIFAIIEKFTG